MITADAPELVLDGGRPLDEQIYQQLRGHIMAGRLQPGEQLPSIRALAVGLAIRPEPVRQALDRLEREGYLTTSEGSGIYVAGPIAASAALPQPAKLARLCREFLAQAARQGFTPAEALAAVSIIIQGDTDHE
jgi:DNA-binding transcriptional regulator YhcF (GntR family)